MNIRAFSFYSVLLLGWLNTQAQDQMGYVLEGTIKGLPDGSKVYLINPNQDTVNQTISQEDRIKMKGKVEDANFYFLVFDTTITKKISSAIWMENVPLKLSGSLENIKAFDIQGSYSQRVYESWMRLSDSVITRGTMKSLIEFVRAYPNSFFTPYAIISLKQMADEKTIKQLYQNLSPEIKSCYWGQRLGEELRADSMALFMKHGSTIADFKVTDQTGNVHRISELVAKNEYTLLDFWASWCSPCREAIPGMKRVLEQYSAKGFGIIGISTDKKPELWKKALQEDKVPWPQMIDNVDFASNNLFSLQAIPGYIILNKKGQIIKKMMLTKNNEMNSENDLEMSGELDKVVNKLFQ